MPVRYAKDGPVVAVLEIYRHPPVFFAVVDRAVALVWLMGGGFVLYTTLFAAVRLGFVHVDHASLDALAVAGNAAWRRSEEALRRMNDTLEAETKRIAHEIHNEAGQLLTVAQLALADVAREMTPAAQESLQEVSCAHLSPGMCSTVVEAYLSGTKPPADHLTPRERQVLQLVAESRTTKQIAQLLGIEIRTAESHGAHLMNKLGIHDTAGLVRYAIRTGLIQL